MANVTGITPASIPTNAPTTITINGTGLYPVLGVTVTWPGGATGTCYGLITYGTGDRLTCVVPAAPRNTTGGTVTVTVTLTGGGNLLTGQQCSLEDGTSTGWGVFANCLVSSSPLQALDGTHCLALNATAAGDMAAVTSLVPLTAGGTYTATCWVRTAASARTVTLFLQWFTAGGALISSSTAAVADSNTGWTQVVVTDIAPATTTQGRVVAYVSATGGAAEVHYFDLISIIGSANTTVTGTVTAIAIGPLTLPTVSVQVAFANNPLTPLGSCTWTDVSRYVGKINLKRGRTHELSRVEVGSLSMQLINYDDRFSPWNTASPYYGPFTDGTDTGVLGLVPMKRVRVRATWPVVGGTTYDVWNGFVDAWPMNWPTEKEAYVDVTCSDAFKLLNLKKVVGKYAATVVADGAASYWRLGDRPSTTAPIDTVTGGYGRVGLGATTPTFGVAGALLSDPNTAVNMGPFTAGGGAAYIDTRHSGMTGTSWSVEAWFQLGSVPSGEIRLIQGSLANMTLLVATLPSFGIDITTAGFAKVLMADAAGLHSPVTGAVNLCDGNWHHIVITANTTTLTVYVDGASIGTGGLTNTIPWVGGLYIGGGSQSGYGGDNAFGGFTIDEVAQYSSVLSAAQVLNHFNLRAGFLTERTDQRIAAVLDGVGWPAADRSLEVGVSQVTAPTQQLGTAAALQHLYDVTDTENGFFSMAPNGQARFTNRNHVLLNATSATSQLTLGEGAEPYDLAGTTVATDDLDIWNEVDVQRVGGVTQVATDAASTARYGPRVLSRTNGLNTTDAESSAAAQYLLSRYKDPQTRVAAVVVHPLSDPATLFPRVLGLDLLDQVTVKRSPIGTGGTILNQFFEIEQIEHATDPAGDWHTTWQLSPHDALAYMVLNDARLGVLNSSRLFY